MYKAVGLIDGLMADSNMPPAGTPNVHEHRYSRYPQIRAPLNEDTAMNGTAYHVCQPQNH